jgi:hypothetical protein
MQMKKLSFFLATLSLCLLPRQLQSQDTSECVAAASGIAALVSPDIISDTSSAFRLLFRCPASGPPQIARIWLRPSLSQTEASALLQRSRLMLDARILTSLLTVARDANRASYIRQAASVATLPYVVREISLDVAMLRRSARATATPPHNFGVSDILVGTSAPSASTTTQVTQLMTELSVLSTDVALQDIGIAGLSAVFNVVPDVVAIPTSAITLTYICGNKFRFRNRTFLNLSLRFDVYGTSSTGRFEAGIPSAGSAQSEVFFFASVPGTVRVFHRTQLLSTKANGGIRCP